MTDALDTNTSLQTESSESNDIRTNKPESTQDTRKKDFTNREELIVYLTQVVQMPVEEVREEVDFLKQLYYKLRKNEIETAKAAFIEGGNDPEKFVVETDLLEETLKGLLNDYKVRKAAITEEKQRLKAENLEKKRAILAQIKLIVEDTDNINKHYNEFNELQNKFKEITDIPVQDVNSIWKEYQSYSEIFYDLLKINKELRDYDFKKNLERKEAICAEAEKLAAESDVLGSFRRLQELHEEWRHIGPVAPNLRDEVWGRFKSASATINKRHQQYFEAIKEVEAKNEAAKTAICEKIEAFDLNALTTFDAWDTKTNEVIELQEEWKKLGYASKKVNNLLFERFRKSCDLFFKQKADYFHNMKEVQIANLEKKKALCEKAESLKDSTDWQHTTDQLVAIQKEWKTIGAVPRKYSDSIWKRFIAACDHFFEQKEKVTASARQQENENLAVKKQVIADLKEIAASEEIEGKNKEVRELMNKWNATGFVPFRDKDKIYKEYQGTLDILFKKLNMHGNKARLDNFAANMSKMAESDKSQNALYREREKLMRTFDHIKSEVKTYENNMGFLSLSSKGGNSLVKEMERKIEKLKEDMNVIAKKIDLIDENLK
ncbi:MAG: DUF349 domain-containing protein [Bacteroidales bacterium]